MKIIKPRYRMLVCVIFGRTVARNQERLRNFSRLCEKMANAGHKNWLLSGAASERERVCEKITKINQIR